MTRLHLLSRQELLNIDVAVYKSKKTSAAHKVQRSCQSYIKT